MGLSVMTVTCAGFADKSATADLAALIEAADAAAGGHEASRSSCWKRFAGAFTVATKA